MKFSIILPVYNAERYLSQCLDSVHCQSYDNWECVCVNDGSTDNSLAILRKVEKGDSRFIVIDKENEGVSVARNTALREITGEYFLFVDADDYLHPECLKIAHHILTENSKLSGIVFKPNCRRFSDNHEAQLFSSEVVSNKYRVIKSPYDFFKSQNFIIGSPWGKIYSSDAYANYRFPVGVRMCEDVYYWDDIVSRVGNWAVVDGVIYLYRFNALSACHGNRCLSWYVDMLKAMCHTAEMIKKYAESRQDYVFAIGKYSNNNLLCQKGIFRLWRYIEDCDRKVLLDYIFNLRAFNNATRFDLALLLYGVCARLNAPNWIMDLCRRFDYLYGSGFVARGCQFIHFLKHRLIKRTI